MLLSFPISALAPVAMSESPKKRKSLGSSVLLCEPLPANKFAAAALCSASRAAMTCAAGVLDCALLPAGSSVPRER